MNTNAPNRPMTLTLADAKALVREVGLTLTSKDGEFKLFPRGGGEAYYTNSLLDAVETARAEAAARTAAC